MIPLAKQATKNRVQYLCSGTHSPRDCSRCLARQISLCSHIDDTGMRELRNMSQPAHFAKGHVVFEEGSELDRVFIVTDGVIKLYRDLPDGSRQITGFLGPGDILGGIKRREKAHCTAEAVTEVEACAFERARFLALLQAFPSLCFVLLFTATDEIEAQNDHTVLLGRRKAPERLAAFLLLLNHRWKIENVDTKMVDLPMSRHDIADHLGLTIETVSRTFAEFKRRGLIATPSPRQAILLNLPELYVLAGFDEVPVRRVALGL